MTQCGFGDEEDAEAWARKKLGVPHPPSFFRAFSVMNNGTYAAVMVLTNFNSFNCDISVAIDKNKLTHTLMLQGFNQLFTYLFFRLKLKRITGLVCSKNLTALKLNKRLNFKQEGVMRHGTRQGDLVVFGMTLEDYQQSKFYQPEVMYVEN